MEKQSELELMTGQDIERLVQSLSRLPGLGPRSARRAVLAMLEKPEKFMRPLIGNLIEAEKSVVRCGLCGNLDSVDPCRLCSDGERDASKLCVVEDVASLWALERANVFRGRYHVLGGVLSPLDGIGPEDLTIGALLARLSANKPEEIILALGATVEGQTTSHYLVDRLSGVEIRVTRLAHGVPIGGELDYLDDGTLGAALTARRPIV